MRPDISGSLTRASIGSPLTPLFLLAAIAVGLLALFTIPREEEPQISVPLVDIHVAVPGLSAEDAVEQVTKPLEQIVMAINDVEHVYSQSTDDGVLVTARFKVGSDADDAIIRVHSEIDANQAQLPPGIGAPVIIGRGIDDVPIVTLTLTASQDAESRWTDAGLTDLANALLTEITKVSDVGQTFIVGGRPYELRVSPDIDALASYGVPLQTLVATVEGAVQAFPAGNVRADGRAFVLQAGSRIESPAALSQIELTGANGRTVFLSDVASIAIVPSDNEARAWSMDRAEGETGSWHTAPAVTLAIAKRQGANAVVVSEQVLARVEALKGSLIPQGVIVKTTRNYGETANHKANELLFHLGLATVSIVALIAFAIGRREAFVTAIVIPTTILLTLFAALMMGYTINRVSLFALIFSIGILVDDAIVMVENIARHWAMKDGRSRRQAAIDAVSEVGNPTVVATLTVIAALLPMMFVSGLMGPYMAPIPANASAAMAFSFFVAVTLAPWLMLKAAGPENRPIHHYAEGPGKLGAFYEKIARPIIRNKKTAWTFLVGVGIATLLACSAFAFKIVTVKLLPFDNKSEFQIVLDMPEGATLEDTERALFILAEAVAPISEIETIQAYAGTAAPFNFNGLVRHYFLRQSPELGDLQVNLAEKSHRKRASHAIALDARERVLAAPLPEGARVKVVEIPPGPPVISTLVAEIYGPDAESRRAVAGEVRAIFESVDFIVDVDDSIGTPRPRLVARIDQLTADDRGVATADVLNTLSLAYSGQTVGVMPRGDGRQPLDIRIAFPRAEQVWSQDMAALPVPRRFAPGAGAGAELGEFVDMVWTEGSPTIFRRDGRFADMVLADLAGQYEAPIYGMLEVQDRLKTHDWGALQPPTVRLYGQPEDETVNTLLWDGEWEVTYVTFRDMGAAFGVALLGIYILVVAQFGSFRLPLIILTPIPLTLIGIVIGHWMFNAPFTATSMIGFIALAGIIVRNSILLVDFVRHGHSAGKPLSEVLIEAGSIRFKPILLTALAAMIGAAVILTDPIFQGLAISLLFGLASSTALTVLVIPAIYVALRGPDWQPAP